MCDCAHCVRPVTSCKGRVPLHRVWPSLLCVCVLLLKCVPLRRVWPSLLCVCAHVCVCVCPCIECVPCVECGLPCCTRISVGMRLAVWKHRCLPPLQRLPFSIWKHRLMLCKGWGCYRQTALLEANFQPSNLNGCVWACHSPRVSLWLDSLAVCVCARMAHFINLMIRHF